MCSLSNQPSYLDPSDSNIQFIFVPMLPVLSTFIMVIDVSERTLRESECTTIHGNRSASVSILGVQEIGKKELCRQKNALWNLLHDVDIESIKLQKG